MSNNITTTKPNSIEAAKNHIISFKAKSETLIASITEITVTGETISNAELLLKEATSLANCIDADRKEMVKPINNLLKSVKELADSIIEPVNEAKATLKTKIIDYNNEVARKEQEERLRQQALIQDRVDKLYQLGARQDINQNFVIGMCQVPSSILKASEEQFLAELQKVELEAEKIKASISESNPFEDDEDKIEEVQIEAVEPPKVTLIPSTQTKAVKGLRKSWVFEITDPAMVMRELCTPDEKLIREAVKNGLREAPGIKIFEKTDVR